MSKITAYISHPIRGKAGNDATEEDMNNNNLKAKTMGGYLRTLMPNLTLYIPAEMDDFLIPRGIKPVKIVEELLALDCAIIKGRDILLVYNHDGHISDGMQREIDYAKEHNIPIIVFDDKVHYKDLINNIMLRRSDG